MPHFELSTQESKNILRSPQQDAIWMDGGLGHSNTEPSYRSSGASVRLLQQSKQTSPAMLLTALNRLLFY